MTIALAIAQGAFGRVALLDMDTPLVGHAHPHCHILLKAGGPDQVFVVGSKPVPMTEDAAVLVNAWEPHRYTPFDTHTRTVFLALYLEPVWLAGLERMFVTCDRPGYFPQPGVSIGPTVRRLRQDLIEMLQHERQDSTVVSETIFSLAANIMHGAATLEPHGAASERRVSDYRIRRAVRMMRDNGAQLGLDEICRGSGLSRPRFNQLFRMCTGVSAGVYQASLRLETAVNSLGIDRQPINLVSDALGFSAQSNFTRFFQQHVGITPSDFRRIAETVTM
ncbi:MAG: AraC family transcriptional regulator [Spirochaetia bacterium]|nr:MAG: AraC family transcriptional regulator [Spirochaetia bacterium]